MLRKRGNGTLTLIAKWAISEKPKSITTMSKSKYQNKKIEVLRCRTENQLASIFTKKLSKDKIQMFTGMFGVKENKLVMKGGC
jgi:hypothetical protein